MKFCRLFMMLIAVSCQSNPKNFKPVGEGKKEDTSIAANNLVDLGSLEEKRQRLLDTNYAFLNKLLDSATGIAYKHGFEQPLELTIDSNVFRFKNMYATISFGHLFSSDRRHLLIKRFINEYTDYETSLYTDIYLLDGNTFKKVAADTSDNGYGGDYYEDANQDGYKDYIVQSYSHAGCCPRNLEKAWLYNYKNGRFKADEFFNREIDSTANLFYETSYGHGDDINLYKYKWSGLKKILLEEIYVTHPYERKKPATYTKVDHLLKRKQILKRLPDDFRKLQMATYITNLGDH